jgi:hypothetical protein
MTIDSGGRQLSLSRRPKRAWTAPVVAALLVLSAGFCVLVAFSVSTPRAAGLPGLFDYVSATWGDGLALPVMTGALVWAASCLPRARGERRAVGTVGAVGAALGVWTQVRWLRDDAPKLNWTLPRPHHFNAAGVYHAVFLTVMCGVASALWTLTLIRIARGPHRNPGSRHAAVGVAAALAAAVSFGVLLAIDALPGRSTGAGGATVVAAGVGAVVLLATLGWAAVLVRRDRSSM